MASLIEVEFSLALNNRTGKYFICRDIINDGAEYLSDKVRYWRIGTRHLPDGLWARLLGRFMTWEVNWRVRSQVFDKVVPRLKCTTPVLFADPLQVLFYELKTTDLVICHDVGPITHPQFYARGVEQLYQKVYSEIVRARPNIVFVTESSKREYERLFGQSHASARVISPAIRNESVSGGLEAVPSVIKPFLLTVGAVGARKNQLGVVRAFEGLGLGKRGVQYVICGGPEPGAEDVFAAAAATEGVVVTGYVGDDQLRWLYANAAGFVLPSFLEGFGIPAAEAVAHGLIPVVTNDGALAEVTGPAAILVDPLDEQDIRRGLSEVLALSAAETEHRLMELRRNVERFTPELAKRHWNEALQAVSGNVPAP
jgi:glycosyltransferase involved in cell wall biosynthesis